MIKLAFRNNYLAISLLFQCFLLSAQNSFPEHLDLLYQTCIIKPENEKNKYLYDDKLKKIDDQLLQILKAKDNRIFYAPTMVDNVFRSELHIIQEFTSVKYDLKIFITNKGLNELTHVFNYQIDKDFNIIILPKDKDKITKVNKSNVFFNKVELDALSIFNKNKLDSHDAINVLILPFQNYGACESSLGSLCLSTIKDKLSEIKVREKINIDIKINTQFNISEPIGYEDAKKIAQLTNADIVIYGQYDPKCESNELEYVRINIVPMEEDVNLAFKKNDQTFKLENKLDLFDLKYEGDLADILFYLAAISTSDCLKMKLYFARIKNFKELPKYYKRLGSCFKNNDNHIEASKLYAEGLRKFPKDEILMKYLAESAENIKQNDLADSVYLEMVKIDPSWYLYYINFLYNTGLTDRLAKTCASFHQKYKNAKEYRHIKYIMAQALYNKVKDSLALELINDALYIADNDARSILLRAQINSRLKKLDLAELDFNSALKHCKTSKECEDVIQSFSHFLNYTIKDSVKLTTLFEASISEKYQDKRYTYATNIKPYRVYLMSKKNYSKALEILSKHYDRLPREERIIFCHCNHLVNGIDAGRACAKKNAFSKSNMEELIEYIYYNIYDDSIKKSILNLKGFIFLYGDDIENYVVNTNPQNKINLPREIIKEKNKEIALFAKVNLLLFSLYLDSVSYNLDSASLYLNNYVKLSTYPNILDMRMLIRSEDNVVLNKSHVVQKLSRKVDEYFDTNLDAIENKEISKNLKLQLFQAQFNNSLRKKEYMHCLALMDSLEQNLWFYHIDIENIKDFYNQKTNFYINVNDHKNALKSLEKYLALQEKRKLGHNNYDFLKNPSFEMLRKYKEFKKLQKKYGKKNKNQ